jgi:outer membrane protein TolC
LSNAAKAWIPQVVLSGQATYQSATPTYPERFSDLMSAYGIEMTGLRNDQYKLAVDVSQNIWDGGLTKANKAIAKADAAEQRSRVDVSLYQLKMRVDQLYFGILLLDERVAQVKNAINVLESNLGRMKSYQKNGVARQSDVDAVEAELLTTLQTLKQIEASRTSYRRMLEVFIGSKLSDATLRRPEMAEVESRVSARPELAMFDAQTNLLSSKRQALRASLMPRFSAFAQGFYGYPGLDMFKDMMSSKWTLNALVGVRMTWNLSAFYTKKNDIAKLNTAGQQVALQRDVFLFNTQMQTVQDDGEIDRLKSAIEDDKRIVELRKSVRIAAESNLKNGMIDATDLLQKIADENNALLNLSTHEIELLQAIYRLKTTLNQ